MATFEIEYQSAVLDMVRRVSVLYPDAAEVTAEEAVSTDIPVLYLLHGMGGNEDSWRKQTAIERLLRHTNLIVVMPTTDLGWYTNTTYGLDYYDAIAKELSAIMQRFFPNMTKKREKTFIAGLSMGGYGAFKIALSTNQYSWAGSFSGAIGIGMDDQDLTRATGVEAPYWTGVFGDVSQLTTSKHVLTNLVKDHDKKTKFYAWCGEEDFLYQANQVAVEQFQQAGLDLTYAHAPGKHEWYYWEKQVEVFLEMLPIDYVKEERLS